MTWSNIKRVLRESVVSRCIPLRPRIVRVSMTTISAVAVSLTLAASSAYATQANPSTNDQSTTINTAWWSYAGITGSQVASYLSANSARLTQIRVENPAGPIFDVTMVSNTGVYGSGWWWYYGLTGSQVGSTLSTNNARLISLEPYVVDGSLLFAVVEVPNTGAQARGWWWYHGISATGIASTLSANNARLVSLQPYQISGTTYYAVIEISNSGVDFANQGWHYNFNQSFSQIAASLQVNPWRLIAMAADPSGGFDVVYIGSEGEHWSWYHGESMTNLVNLMLNSGQRLIDITPYTWDGSTVYAGVGLDDINFLQSPVNSASTNVDNFAAANGWGGGLFGAYLAPAASPGSPLVAFNSGYRFEPASTIKVLYLLYALKQVQAGADALSSPLTYYVDPADPTNQNVCPQLSWEAPANAVTTTLGNALQLMMFNSDNRVTRAMEERYGISNVQAMATSLGLSQTSLRQAFIGCAFQGGARNELTTSDAAHLYSLVQQGLELSPYYTNIFFNEDLPGGLIASSNYLVTVIYQEAAKLGKSSVASAFAGDVFNHWKAGSYSLCMANDCSASKVELSIAGVLTLPAKTTYGAIVPTSYAYSDFVNDLYMPCAPNSGCPAENAGGAMIGEVAAEAARPAIDQALQNW
jgi:Beta-lactamase enzyme family